MGTCTGGALSKIYWAILGNEKVDKPFNEAVYPDQKKVYQLILVEARGIEPLSENSFMQLSPGTACCLHSLVRPPTGGLPDSVSLIHPQRRGTRRERSPLI